ncbi:MAG: RDD family protein [Bacteroidota bacterium]
MNNDSTGIMTSKSDQDLVKILAFDRDSYSSATIAAAENEVQKRGIDVMQYEALKKEIINDNGTPLAFSESANGFHRLMHWVTDTIFVIIFDILVFVIAFYFLEGVLSENDMLTYAMVFFYLSFPLYYIITEAVFQRTIGKMFTGTVVITNAGKAPTVGDALARTFCRLIPFDAISFLFTRHGFHDNLSSTKVVYGKPQKAGETQAEVLHD